MPYNSKNNQPKKEKRAKELWEFRYIFNRLREKFTLKEMEKITGFPASNLSAYGSGAKNPRTSTIKKFNTKLKSHIAKLSKSNRAEKNSDHVEEERAAYGKSSRRTKDHIGDLIKILSTNNDRMWTDNQKNGERLDKMVETSNKLADNTNKLLDNSNKLLDNSNKLVDNNTTLVNTNAELVATNTRLAERLFPNSGTNPTPQI